MSRGRVAPQPARCGGAVGGVAEQLSAHGFPVVVADVKGDVSGLLSPGDAAGGAGTDEIMLDVIGRSYGL